jgi:putative peptidoglycan lipid II flippase
VLGSVLRRRGWLRLDREARRRLPRIAIATVAMGIAVGCGAALRLFPAAETSSFGRLFMLLGLVTLGIVIYGAALHALDVAKLREIAAEIRTRA